MARRVKGSDEQGDLFGDVTGDGPDADDRTVTELLKAYVCEIHRQLEAAGTECTAFGAAVDARSQRLQGRITVKRARDVKVTYELVWVEAVGWTLAVRLTRRKAAVRAYMRATLTPPIEDVVAWAREVLRGRPGHTRPRVMQVGGAESLRWQLLAVVPAGGGSGCGTASVDGRGDGHAGR